MSHNQIGKYYSTKSLIHKLSPSFKIISTIITVIAILFINSPIEIAFVGFYILTIISWTNIPPKLYLKTLSNSKFFLLAIILINIICNLQIINIIYIVTKIIYTIIYSSVLLYTTKETEIVRGIALILSPFSKWINTNKIAFTISMSMTCIPGILDTSDLVHKSYQLRSPNTSKIKSMITLIIPIFTISLNKVDDISYVITTRLYNPNKKRTNYILNKWKKLDTILLVVNILVLVITIIY